MNAILEFDLSKNKECDYYNAAIGVIAEIKHSKLQPVPAEDDVADEQAAEELEDLRRVVNSVAVATSRNLTDRAVSAAEKKVWRVVRGLLGKYK